MLDKVFSESKLHLHKALVVLLISAICVRLLCSQYKPPSQFAKNLRNKVYALLSSVNTVYALIELTHPVVLASKFLSALVLISWDVMTGMTWKVQGRSGRLSRALHVNLSFEDLEKSHEYNKMKMILQRDSSCGSIQI